MSIDNPQTYAEWYWANQVDASKTFADDEEESIKPFLDGIVGLISDLDGVPPELLAALDAFGTSGHFGLTDIGKAIVGEGGKGVLSSGLDPILRAVQYSANKKLSTKFAPLEAVLHLKHRLLMTDEQFKDRAAFDGYGTAQAEVIARADEAYPDVEDLIRWSRYQSNDIDTFTMVNTLVNIDKPRFDMFDWLTRPLFGVGDVQTMYMRGDIDESEALQRLHRIGWLENSAQEQLKLGYSIPSPMIALQSGLHTQQDRSVIKEFLGNAGVHPDWQQDYIDAVLSKPGPQDLIRWRLRTDPNLETIRPDLERIGVHPDYMDVFKTLAFSVPGIGEIVSMAASHVWEPDIANRLGVFADMPEEVIRYASMNGVSEEWARRYWATHWKLPNLQQGFDMFHRGIIDNGDIQLLLKAADIMPFWQDKLLQASYMPLTRLDLRRLYLYGVIDQAEVEHSFRELGYTDENATKLTKLIVKQVATSQTGFKTGNVTGAFKDGFIDRDEAFNLLDELGIKGSSIPNILNTCERQRDWTTAQAEIKAVANEYKQTAIDETAVRDRLGKLHLPDDRITAMLGQWYKEKNARTSVPWTRAETVQLYQRSFITEDRATQELYNMGYDDEHIAGIMANAGYKKPTKEETTGETTVV